MCHVRSEGFDHDGYVPGGLGIGGGDYLDFVYCLDCGQMQGEFPIPKGALRDVILADKHQRLQYLQRQHSELHNFGATFSMARHERLSEDIAQLQQEIEALEASTEPHTKETSP